MKPINQARPEHIDTLVRTVGVVDLDLEDSSPGINEGAERLLPPGFPMVLRHIDKDDMAYAYHVSNGVMRMPAVLLIPRAATG